MLASCGPAGTDTISVKLQKDCQTMEGFGASAAWWAQDVGAWTEPGQSGETVRDEILTLLYGDAGIDLDIYRYNLGAGSKGEADASYYSDPWRKTQSFLTADGTVDYTLDAAAVWCMEKAASLGVGEVVFFSNSAPDTMTINGKTHCDPDPARLDYTDENGTDHFYSLPNLDASQYRNFADYALDAVEHFRAAGVPVTSVSPINEPQWTWQGGQEGCHYEPEEVVALYKVFLAEMQARNLTDSVELAMFESGQPYGDTLKRYVEAIADDDTLSPVFRTLDTHSYWGTAEDKEKTARYLRWHYPDMTVRCTEWTEMVNGRDVTMDSALVLANTVIEDLTILDAASWSYWIAVSAYDYRDGLIYVDRDAHTYETTKRLWALGNFSRFVKPGAVRVETKLAKDSPLSAVAFRDGKTATVVVVNATDKAQPCTLDFGSKATFSGVEAYVTDAARDLENAGALLTAADGAYTGEVPAQSVTTFVFA